MCKIESNANMLCGSSNLQRFRTHFQSFEQEGIGFVALQSDCKIQALSRRSCRTAALLLGQEPYRFDSFEKEMAGILHFLV